MVAIILRPPELYPEFWASLSNRGRHSQTNNTKDPKQKLLEARIHQLHHPDHFWKLPHVFYALYFYFLFMYSQMTFLHIQRLGTM